MNRSLFGKSIRSVPGTSNLVNSDYNQYSFYHDFMGTSQGLEIVSAASLNVQRLKSMSLGLYYSNSRIEFKMESKVIILLNSISEDNFSIIIQFSESRINNEQRVINLIGNSSKARNNNRLEVNDFIANSTEPSVPSDSLITNELFKNTSSINISPVDISYSLSSETLKLSGSIAQENEQNSIIGFLVSSSNRATYNLKMPNLLLSGVWE